MADQQGFINSIKDGAIEGLKSHGILASLTIAQAIEESGWGEHAPGNNLFGIKAGAGWTGATQTLNTSEEINGVETPTTAVFRAYASQADSIADHAAFLAENSRYANIINCGDAAQACRNILADGYATESNYADELISIINEYNLTQYDVVAAPAAQAAPSGDPAIVVVQNKLNRLQLVAALAVDGINGPKTQEAVEALQRLAEISVDGVYGPVTDGAYNSIVSKPELTIGSTGAAVKYVQARLGVDADGIFGPHTNGVVRAFQQSHGLDSDGIVGANTWGALIG